MRIIRPAMVVACAALLALALPASRAQAAPRSVAGLRVVASFNPAQGQNPENVVVAPDGTVYVTWLSAHAVVAVRPDGSQVTVSPPPGEATGIAIDPVKDMQEIIASGDTVATRWVLTGSLQQDYMGIPASGQKIRVEGMNFYRLKDGRVTDIWTQFDGTALMRQLGATPA